MEFLHASVSQEAAGFTATLHQNPGSCVTDTSFPDLSPLENLSWESETAKDHPD